MRAKTLLLTGTFLAMVSTLLAAGRDKIPIVAPGQILWLAVPGLDAGLHAADALPLPFELGGVTVAVGDLRAPLLSVRPGALVLQVPFEIPLRTDQKVRVEFRGKTLESVIVTDSQAPALLAPIFHADWTLVSKENPTRPGEVLVAFATGLGRVTPAVATGVASHTAVTIAAPRVVVGSQYVWPLGGTEAEVGFSGLVAGFVGLYQVNFQVPPDTPAGEVNLFILGGDAGTTSATTIPVSR